MKATGLLAVASLMVAGNAWGGSPPEWRGYGGDEQHNANSPVAAQGLTKFHWKTPVDLHPQYEDGELLIHYAEIMITGSNTVLVPVKTGLTGDFRVEARNGTTGKLIWQKNSSWIVPPHDWTPSFPAHLTAQNNLVYAGAGGTVEMRPNPDSKTGKAATLAFYGLSLYKANKQAFNSTVMVDTPITADSAGNLYFGFVVTGSNPANVTSGLARISSNGTGTWISAGNAANDATMTEVAMNCAPAISLDQSTVYVGVSNGSSGYLVGLDSTTLQPKYRAALTDPSSGDPAWIDDDSSASPTVGPDGDVYYGVLENPFPNHDDRGWLLHYDATLTTLKTPGSFGWDDTVSVVPASIVSSYTGSSAYLLMSKYNNYYDAGPYGDGHNKIAVLDPDATQKDEYSNTTVMKEILTLIGQTQVQGEPQGSVDEWCINSAVIDPVGKAIFANSEDGHDYRWDMTTGTISSKLKLNAPLGEAYTSTVIGPDGTIYATNNATLYAIGN
ncbi:MAG: hypothetical protein ABSD74_16215 [Rhizomicrobium sp.]|jgi:hypothetical protein